MYFNGSGHRIGGQSNYLGQKRDLQRLNSFKRDLQTRLILGNDLIEALVSRVGLGGAFKVWNSVT